MELGLTYTSSMVVEECHLAQSVGSGDLPVLATPVMIMLMENAAMLAVAGEINSEESTVGSQISATHLRPTPLADTITATATLKAVEGRKLTFAVVAEDSKGVIGEGTHVRYIINRERFVSKITL